MLLRLGLALGETQGPGGLCCCPHAPPWTQVAITGPWAVLLRCGSWGCGLAGYFLPCSSFLLFLL